MPYKDRSKGYEIDRKSAKKIYISSTTIRFRRDDKHFYDRLLQESDPFEGEQIWKPYR